MKNYKKTILSMALIGAVAFACKKEETTPEPEPTPTPTKTCKMMSSSEVRGSDTYGQTVSYNANGKVSKVSYTYGTNTQVNRYDSVVYTAGGEIDKIYEVDINDPFNNKVYSYTYSNGKISTITETGDNNGTVYNAVTTISWSSGNMSQIATTGNPNGDNSVFKNITHSNGNLSNLHMDYDGSGMLVIKLQVSSVDDKKNVGRFSLPKPDALLEYYNSNNIVKVVTTEQALIPNGVDSLGNFTFDTIPAGTIMLDNQYTYTSENEVNVKIEKPSGFDDPSNPNKTSTYTYECN